MPPIDPHQRYEMWEASRYLRHAESTIYNRIRREDIRVIRDNGRLFIPGTEIIRLSSLPGAAVSAPMGSPDE